jgi:hypothetical protein
MDAVMSVPSPTIDVRPQVRLSLAKSFRFCKKGISYRLFRSLLTLAVVVVAVAFFMFLLGESVIVRSVSRGVQAQTLEMREADVLLTRLFDRYTSRDFSAMLAASQGRAERVDAIARVSSLSTGAASRLVERSALEQRYLDFFDNLAVGKRVVLVKIHKGRDVFTYLNDTTAWHAFLGNLANMRSVTLPTDSQTFRSFLDEYATFIDDLELARNARTARVATMQTALSALSGGAPNVDWLAQASPEQVEQWRGIVVEHGFGLAQEAMPRLCAFLRVSSWERGMTQLLQSPEKRAAWKQAFKTTPTIEEKMLALSLPKVGEIVGEAFSSEQRLKVADRYSEAKRLRSLSAKLPRPRRGVPEPRFLDGRQTFLVVISFLVCMVGIANAMLMAITERFREIATMKCLGATDGFILKQFLIEAAIQGCVGGALGMLIGLLIAVLKTFAGLGTSVFQFFPTMPLLVCAGFTLFIGVLLAMLASIYPSRAAARMAPMDAMRVE